MKIQVSRLHNSWNLLPKTVHGLHADSFLMLKLIAIYNIEQICGILIGHFAYREYKQSCLV